MAKIFMPNLSLKGNPCKTSAVAALIWGVGSISEITVMLFSPLRRYMAGYRWIYSAL